MKKKTGSNYSLYLPDQLIAKAKVVADERDRSTSFIVACALRQYLSPSQELRS